MERTDQEFTSHFSGLVAQRRLSEQVEKGLKLKIGKDRRHYAERPQVLVIWGPVSHTPPLIHTGISKWMGTEDCYSKEARYKPEKLFKLLCQTKV